MLRAADLGILADDLTGACDAASSFAPACGPVVVHVRLPHRPAPAPAAPPAGAPQALRVLNTQSRLLRPAAGRRQAARAARRVRGAAVVYKKIDSVLRGPAGAELEGVARVLPGHAIHLIPAVPDLGKTTRDGRLLERGVPADQTEYAADPLSPVTTSDIRRIVAATGRVQFAVPDVQSNEDLDREVDRALHKGRAVLAGSVGLADALARHVEHAPRDAPGRAGRAAQGSIAAVSAPPTGGTAPRVLVLCGSGYAVSREQMRRAGAAAGRRVLPIGEETRAQDAVRSARGGEVALLAIRTDPVLAGARLARLFRKVGRIVRALDPRALAVIGGETAFRLLGQLGARTLEVHGRIQPGVSFGVILDGALAGRPFAAKGGSVGTPDACERMIDHLRAGEGAER